MAKLTFPVTRTGLGVPVLIGVNDQATAALRAAGQPIPAPLVVRGLLDTGTSVTSVAGWALQRLALAAIASGTTQTASGIVPVNLFRISLSITDPAQRGSPWLTFPDLLVTELTTALADADILIGLDVLLDCRFLLDGPARQFSLEF